MCEYTSHGHCGILENTTVDNDKALPYLAKIAIFHADAGADIVAPSDMTDGRVSAIHEALKEALTDELEGADFLMVKYKQIYHSWLTV